MHTHRLAVIACFALLSVAGCSSDEVAGATTVLPPTAFVRYVNAVPDTSSLDFRFVDGDIEASPQFPDVTFRSFTAYQRARVGTRRLRVFTNALPYGSSAAVAAQMHIDTTFTFEENKRYTIISFGFARTSATPRHRLVILTDNLPTTLSATQIGVRTIHAAAGVGSVDVYVRPTETPAGIAGATPTATGVAQLAATAYLTLDARPTGGALLYRWDLAAAGSSAALTVTPSSGLPGSVGTTSANPLSGFQVGRSIITAILLGPAVVGSRAPQTSDFTNPGIRFLPDFHLDTSGR